MECEKSSKVKDINSSIHSESKPECKMKDSTSTSKDLDTQIGSRNKVERAVQPCLDYCNENSNSTEQSNPNYCHEIGFKSETSSVQNLDGTISVETMDNDSRIADPVVPEDNVSSGRIGLAQTSTFDAPDEIGLENKVRSLQISSTDENVSENKSLPVTPNAKSGEGASGSSLLPATRLLYDYSSSNLRSLDFESTESLFKLPENLTRNSRTREQKKATRKQKNRLSFEGGQNKGYDFQAASHTLTDSAQFEWKSSSSEISSNDEKSPENRKTYPVFNMNSDEDASENYLLRPISSLFNDNCSRSDGSPNFESTESLFKLPEKSTRGNTRELKRATRKLKKLLNLENNQNTGSDFLPASHTWTKSTPSEWKCIPSQISGGAFTDENTSDTKHGSAQSSSSVKSDLTNSGNRENLKRKIKLEVTYESDLVSKIRSLNIFSAVSPDEHATGNKTGLSLATFFAPDEESLDSNLKPKTETYKSSLEDSSSRGNELQSEEKLEKEKVKSGFRVSKFEESDCFIFPTISSKCGVKNNNELYRFSRSD